MITSKTRLVAYLEEALKQASAGDRFRLESVKKADDARAAAARGTVAGTNRSSIGPTKRNAERVVAHWHALAEDPLRHHVYRTMKAKGMKIGNQPFMLLEPIESSGAHGKIFIRWCPTAQRRLPR